MKRTALKQFALSALAASGFLPFIGHAAEPIPVVATFSILGDLVKVVGGDRVAVTTLAGPDADAHEFNPSPAHAKAVFNARLFVLNGLNFEPWAQKLAKSAGYKGDTVVASQGVKPRQLATESGHTHGETDPHAWQNPLNVILYVNNIASRLAKLDPSGAVKYRANAEVYAKQLRDTLKNPDIQ